MPEVEQGLSEASGKDVKVSFTPHLINMSRCEVEGDGGGSGAWVLTPCMPYALGVVYESVTGSDIPSSSS